MKFSKVVFGIVVMMLMHYSSLASASDQAKEKRWYEQVVADLFDGEAVDLNDGANDFLGLWTESESPGKTAIIIMHGLGVHPDWPHVINPLRVELAEKGWSTLSIQLPVLGNEAEGKDYLPLMDEVAPRVDAAITMLNEAGYQQIVLVAHSLGAQMASYYLSHAKQPRIKAFAGIGMNVGNTQNLKNISLPVLDLYGSNDLPGVLDSAKDRKAASGHNPAYQQKIAAEADHFFDGYEAILLEDVSGWLEQL